MHINSNFILRHTLLFCLLQLVLCVFDADAQVKFIPNKGQWKAPFLYKSHIPGGAVFISSSKIWYSFADAAALHEISHNANDSFRIIKKHALGFEWIGANKNVIPRPSKPSSEYYNYFLSSNPANWKSGLHAYEALFYKGIYAKTDMLIEGKGDALKYTYFVQPGALPSAIKIKISGAENIAIKERNLHIKTSISTVIEEAPIAYQTIGNKQIDVPCNFVLEGDVISFVFPKGYNTELPLVIDPTVIFASYSGSLADNFGFTATYDAFGNAYGGGTVFDNGFPVTTGAFQDTFAGGEFVNGSIGDFDRDAAILKFSPDGKKLLWATYLGGTRNEQPHSMVVDGNNDLIVLGTTYSTDFPVVEGSYDTSQNGKSDIYLVKFSEDGKKMLGGTYVGGKDDDGLNGLIPTGVVNRSPLGYNYGDQFRGEVVCDSLDNIYVGSTTFSKDFPVSISAAQKDTGKGQDGCIFKLNSSLSTLLWSTYAGGAGSDAVYSLQIDSQYNVYACGGTNSPYFFKDTITYNNKLSGTAVDGFICVVSHDGKHFLNSTYIGTSAYDQCHFVQLDKNENVYVYGQTKSTAFPVKNAVYKNAGSGQFISKFNKSLDTLLVSTVFGSGRSTPDISPTAFLVDNCDKIYISGWGGDVNSPPLGGGGNTKGMPLTNDAFQKKTDGSDFYVAVFARNMDTILYGSYFGGLISGEHVDGGTSRFDKKGVIYQSVCGGCGGNSDFPVTDSAWSETNNSTNCNNLVFKVNLETPDMVVDFDTVKPDCAPYTVTFKNKSYNAKTYIWNFGDGDTSSAKNPTHTFAAPGTYTVRLTGTNFFSCSVHDTMIKKLVVIHPADTIFQVTKEDCSRSATFEATGFGNDFHWDFGDNTFGKGRKITHTYLKPGNYKVKLFADTAKMCGDSASQSLSVNFPIAYFLPEYDTCKPIVYFKNYSAFAQTYLWIFEDGTTDTAQNPVHDFKKAGIYEAKLIATDSLGCKDTSAIFVNIVNSPKSSFIAKPRTCEHAYIFKSTSQKAKTYLWSFGDGKSSVQDSIRHVYDKPGTYKVTLIINGNSQCPSTSSQTIHISFPTAAFKYTLDPCKPIVNFSNESIFSQRYIWDFGDSTATDTSKNTYHRYKKAGTYLVKLYAIDSSGCKDSAFKQVVIDDTLRAGFETFSDTCSGESIFINQSEMAQSYFWDFGDGTSDTARKPVHTYLQKNRTYKVKLITTSAKGCVDSISKDIFVYERPVAAFSVQKDSCSNEIRTENTSYRATAYLWDFGDGDTSSKAAPKHIYNNKGNYTVQLIINPFTACADTAETSFYMPRDAYEQAIIPNVITPNGDNANDVLHIANLSQCLVYELIIYNRWGQIIYENKGNKMYWDGTNKKGVPVSEGTYFYVFNDPLYGKKMGTITVLR